MHDRSRALIGALLIGAGIIFLLDAADVIAAGDVFRKWWPLVFVALGLIALVGRPRSWVGGGILIAIGAVLLLSTLDIVDIPAWQLAIPLILIAAGLSLVFRGLGRGARDTRDAVSIVAILSDQRVTSESTAFKRATVTSILGDATLDLRKARLDPGGASVDTFSALADVVVLVPRGWRINVNGIPILADFDDETDHSVDVPEDAPEISVTGVALLGDVDVKHER
jgi:predicted membrane protein